MQGLQRCENARFEHALQVHRQTRVRLQQDGNVAFRAGDYKRAVEMYSKCIDLDSSMVAARANRAMAYLKAGEPQSALDDCEAVIAQDARNVKCWLRKGQAHWELERCADAEAAWRECLRLQPSNAQAAELLRKATERSDAA